MFYRAKRIREQGRETFVISETPVEIISFIETDSTSKDAEGHSAMTVGTVESPERLKRNDIIVDSQDKVNGNFYRIHNVQGSMVGLYTYTLTEER